MGLFSSKKELFITTEHTPTGYQSLGLVSGVGRGETAKAFTNSKKALQDAAAELGATGIANFEVSPGPSVSGSNSLIAYGEAIKPE